MAFGLTALFPGMDFDVALDFCARNSSAKVTRKNTLVVRLAKNPHQSQANYPTEWRMVDPGTNRFRPDFSSGMVHQVYDFPAELADMNHRFVLESAEKRKRGSCQIITGYTGGRLRPLCRIHESRAAMRRVHPTITQFTVAKIGKVWADFSRSRLVIQRALVERTDGLVVVAIEQLFMLEDSGLSLATCDNLPPELETWRPALRALFERWECTKVDGCDGHYHLD